MPSSAAIPTYKLYGEASEWPTPELIHCETIAARSSLHDWAIRPHRHADLFQLFYCRTGAVRLALDGTTQNLSAPCLVTVPAMCVHGFQFEHGCQGWVLTLPEFALKRFVSQDEGLFEHFCVARAFSWADGPRRHPLDPLFERFATEFVKAEAGRLLALEAILGLILVLVARESSWGVAERRGAEDRNLVRLRTLRELVENHFREWRPVSFYAAELGVTPAQLNNICRSGACQTALEVVHERIMIEAKRYLVYTCMTASEVAYALGFSDPAYFTRFFKKRAGQSPSVFRTTRRMQG
ncbi:MAG: helix-turn-helix domain-containing protein [Deferrisomatales bacterium]|nr:helix-turn-helix domain-containing protein [Deferrisomatales bacterium]